MRSKELEEEKYFDPRLCTYKLSGKVRNHVQKVLESNDVEQDTIDHIKEVMEEEEANKNTLGYESLTTLHKYLQRADDTYVETPFWVFKDSCKCIKPKPRVNEQLDRRLHQLRLKDSQNWYTQAAADVDKSIENKLLKSSQTSVANAGDEFRVFNGSVMAVVNSFLVYICAFIFCYKALEHALPEPNIVGQVVFGIVGSTIVAVAELYFLARVI